MRGTAAFSGGGRSAGRCGVVPPNCYLVTVSCLHVEGLGQVEVAAIIPATRRLRLAAQRDWTGAQSPNESSSQERKRGGAVAVDSHFDCVNAPDRQARVRRRFLLRVGSVLQAIGIPQQAARPYFVVNGVLNCPCDRRLGSEDLEVHYHRLSRLLATL